MNYYFTLLVSALCLLGSLASVKSIRNDNVNDPTLRIAGGERIRMNRPEVNFMVSIQIKNSTAENNGTHICGGVIINANWLATAASCIGNLAAQALRVEASNDDHSVTYNSQLKDVSYIVKHKDFSKAVTPYLNDLALIRVADDLRMDEQTQPANLGSSTSPVYTENCYEAGWGTTGGTELETRFLYIANVTLLDSSYCITAYGNLPDGSICGGNLEGGVGFCKGDMGGPFVCHEKDSGKSIVAGIISYREGCAEPNKPGVYTEIAEHMEWIIGITNSPE